MPSALSRLPRGARLSEASWNARHRIVHGLLWLHVPVFLVLGILGFTFGSLLGLFLVGLFTKGRGNDGGNVLGVIAGIAAVAWASGVPHKFFPGLPEIIPGFVLAFPWRITLGTLVTFVVVVCFRTPEDRIAARAAADATHA